MIDILILQIIGIAMTPILAGVGWYIIHKHRKQDKKDEESPFGQSVAGLR